MKKIIIALFCAAMAMATPKVSAQIASTVIEIPATMSGSDVMKEIGDIYKDKVVIIDFWATWCGPCRAALKEIDQIKENLTAKGVAFAYITGETSPLADWSAAIPSIAGDHIRLTKTQWQYIVKSLGMSGIPTYMILNKDGSTAYSNVTEGGYPGNELIEAEANKALTHK